MQNHRYHCHILHFPNAFPFDRLEYRWPSFVGEFVAPIVGAHPGLLCWCCYYGDSGHFKVYTDDYPAIQGQLESLRDQLKLRDDGQDKNLTLENDLGTDRFRSPNSKTSETERAILILRSFHAVSNLLVNGVVKRPDGYWEPEENGDNANNPVGNYWHSVIHLHHRITENTTRVYVISGETGFEGVLSQYDYYEWIHRGGPKSTSIVLSANTHL